MVEENLKRLKERIDSACQRAGRNPEEITLVCVTKTVGIDKIKEVLNCGISDIGENYVQEALAKSEQLKELDLKNPISWHMVGHLQKNKAKYAVGLFNLIHSIDSLDLAAEVDRCAQKVGKIVDVLIQVNTSGEGSKFGLSPRELRNSIDDMRKLKNLRIRGLMTIAPFSDNPEASRPFFRKLRLLKEEIKFSDERSHVTSLSMGMTQDFGAAIEEGANILRIGRAIFGER